MAFKQTYQSILNQVNIDSSFFYNNNKHRPKLLGRLKTSYEDFCVTELSSVIEPPDRSTTSSSHTEDASTNNTNNTEDVIEADEVEECCIAKVDYELLQQVNTWWIEFQTIHESEKPFQTENGIQNFFSPRSSKRTLETQFSSKKMRQEVPYQ